MSKKIVSFYEKKSALAKYKVSAGDKPLSSALREALFEAIKQRYVPSEAQMSVVTSKVSINMSEEEKQTLEAYVKTHNIKNLNSFIKHSADKYLCKNHLGNQQES